MPLVTSSGVTEQPNNLNSNNCFIVILLTAETCAKLEPEEGEVKNEMDTRSIKNLAQNSDKIAAVLSQDHWQHVRKCVNCLKTKAE